MRTRRSRWSSRGRRSNRRRLDTGRVRNGHADEPDRDHRGGGRDVPGDVAGADVARGGRGAVRDGAADGAGVAAAGGQGGGAGGGFTGGLRAGGAARGAVPEVDDRAGAGGGGGA